MRLIAACILIVAACGSSQPKTAPPPSNLPVAETEPAPPPPAPPMSGQPTDAEFEAMMRHALAMFNAMGDAADAAGADCDKLADNLDRVLTDHTAFLTAAKKYKSDPEIDRRGEVWLKAHLDELMPAMTKISAAGQKCTSNARFMAAMERLGEIE